MTQGMFRQPTGKATGRPKIPMKKQGYASTCSSEPALVAHLSLCALTHVILYQTAPLENVLHNAL